MSTRMAAGYEERPPPSRLAPYVACFWRSTNGATPLVTNVVPDACADVISRDGHPPSVVGPMTEPSRIELARHATVLGVRFRPHVASALLGVPADALTDRAVTLAELGMRDLAWLDDALATRDVERGLGALARLLGTRLERAVPIDRVVEHAVRWLARHPASSVRALERDVDIGNRQLRRRFDTAVGFGPKTLQRVLRFQRFLVSTRDRSLAAAATDAGYADQPHMTREVRELSGVTPSELVRASPLTPTTSDFFKTLGPDRATLGA